MSFTQDVKQEVSLHVYTAEEEKAALSALIQLTASLSISRRGPALSITTENAAVSRAIFRMLKNYDVEIIPSVKRRMNLKKNLIYQLRAEGSVQTILEDTGIYSAQGLRDRPLRAIVRKDQCARAYLAGAFMAEGSVNSPRTSNYHLEIKAANPKHAEFLTELMKRFYIDAKIIERRGHSVVYVKSAEKIADFLRVIDASDNLMRFEDTRISRDITNSITRLNNVEVANEMKSFKAAAEQLEDIEVLERYDLVRNMDPKLRDVIELRKEEPYASLNELAESYRARTGSTVSKSGLKHRFVKIHEAAMKASGQKDE